jgi:hypothetical protein
MMPFYYYVEDANEIALRPTIRLHSNQPNIIVLCSAVIIYSYSNTGAVLLLHNIYSKLSLYTYRSKYVELEK